MPAYVPTDLAGAQSGQSDQKGAVSRHTASLEAAISSVNALIGLYIFERFGFVAQLSEQQHVTIKDRQIWQ